jgi:3-methylfumaryl-CoA hydratase
MDEIRRSELITAGPAEALAGLLGVRPPDLLGGDGLPLLWHWLYLLERPAQAELGFDGHPLAGSVPSPPGPGRRRMFAGGRVHALAPLRIGEPATRRSVVRSTKETSGRFGSLTIVTVAHEIAQSGRIVIAEEQDIVYREAPTAAVPAASTSDGEAVAQSDVDAKDDDWTVHVDPVLLFRFSALTYNGHRIHYDRDYARDVELYPGLVVHGPLQAIAMVEAARRKDLKPTTSSSPVEFAYRLIAPLFDHQGLVASARSDGDEVHTGIRDSQGRITASGTIRAVG